MTDRPATEPPPCKHCGATGPFPRSHKYIPPEGGAPRACNCNAEMYGNGDRHSDDCATGLGAASRAEGLTCEICRKPGHDAESCPAAEWGDLAAPLLHLHPPDCDCADCTAAFRAAQGAAPRPATDIQRRLTALAARMARGTDICVKGHRADDR